MNADLLLHFCMSIDLKSTDYDPGQSDLRLVRRIRGRLIGIKKSAATGHFGEVARARKASAKVAKRKRRTTGELDDQIIAIDDRISLLDTEGDRLLREIDRLKASLDDQIERARAALSKAAEER